MIREYSIPEDYAHIRSYGQIMGWTKDLIKAMQWRAYRVNAPYDTVELSPEGAIVRFRDLAMDVKKQFMEIRS